MYLTEIDFIIILNLLVSIIGLSAILFNKKNFLLTLISIEIVFLGINLNFIFISVYLDDIIGQVFVFFILAIIACESAIVLSFLVIIYKFRKTISIINTNKYFTSKF